MGAETIYSLSPEPALCWAFHHKTGSSASPNSPLPSTLSSSPGGRPGIHQERRVLTNRFRSEFPNQVRREIKERSEFSAARLYSRSQPAREIYKCLFIPKVQQGLGSPAQCKKSGIPLGYHRAVWGRLASVWALRACGPARRRLYLEDHLGRTEGLFLRSPPGGDT